MDLEDERLAARVAFARVRICQEWKNLRELLYAPDAFQDSLNSINYAEADLNRLLRVINSSDDASQLSKVRRELSNRCANFRSLGEGPGFPCEDVFTYGDELTVTKFLKNH